MHSLTHRGIAAWLLALVIITFYTFLYFSNDIDRALYAKQIQTEIEAIDKKITSAQPPEKKADISKKVWQVLYSAGLPGQNNFHSKLKDEYVELAKQYKQKFSATRVMNILSMPLNGLSHLMKKKPANKWFLYGFLYTFFVLVFGIRFWRKHRSVKYHTIRTASLVFVQLILAFIVPALLAAMNTKEFYFSYFWPLKFEYFTPSFIAKYPSFLVFWALTMAFIATPVLAYFFGKRWYCSWVCGCGALAETAGDSFRRLSNKSKTAWNIEKLLIYPILFVTVAITILLFVNQFRGIRDSFSEFAFAAQKIYGYIIGSIFAGAIGTGLYSLLGNRVWCRFGCPMAAILGIIQVTRSRFRITVNGSQCMSCGNCSAYCEMGIDVRSYAQVDSDVVRASCVGCGICATVCPRGVLKLENAEPGKKMGERNLTS